MYSKRFSGEVRALTFSILLLACSSEKKEPFDALKESKKTNAVNVVQKDTVEMENFKVEKAREVYNDTAFVDLASLDNSFLYEMKYATKDNFLKEKVYECDQCFLRYKTALKLIEANNEFKKKGYTIKLFDCFRPLNIQKKMWGIIPDSRYVANPNTLGSVHNRGGAVDLTLTDSAGKELDMGSPFDHFGQESHLDYPNIPEEAKKNREILRTTMVYHGFKGLNSEWWHFTYGKYSLSDSSLCK